MSLKRKVRRDDRFAEVREAFGKRMKNERTARRFTQDQVAGELEVTQPRVSEWECGKAFPSVPQIIGFCRYIGIGLERLFEGLAPFDSGQMRLAGLEPEDRRALEHIAAKLQPPR